MNNVQLYLSVGIPSLLIVLTWLNSSTRFTRIEARLDKHDLQFEEIKDSQHKDALLILKTMTDLHERVAVVETKQAMR